MAEVRLEGSRWASSLREGRGRAAVRTEAENRGSSESWPGPRPPNALPVLPLLGLVSFVLTVFFFFFKVNWLFFLGLVCCQNEK